MTCTANEEYFIASKHTLLYRQLQVIKTRQLFFRALLGSDLSQDNAPVQPASLLFQFIVVMDLETTNEEKSAPEEESKREGKK